MASNDVIDGNVLDPAEQDTTGVDIQKKATLEGIGKEIGTSADQAPASDEGRQAENTQQGGNTITHEDQERQSVEREPPQEGHHLHASTQDEGVGSAASQEVDVVLPTQEDKVEVAVVFTASEESKEASKRFRDENVKIGKSDRNILENPTELYVLIQHKKWDDALQRVKTNTSEASEWTYRKDNKGNMMWRLLPLHASIILNAPEKLVKAILSAYPRGVQCQDDLGMLPIHLAFRAGISPTIAKILLQAYPQATEVRDFKGRRPLGLAQASTSPHREAFLHLLKPQPVTSFTKEDLDNARAEAIAAVKAEEQAAFAKQMEHMKRVYQLEIDQLETKAAKMDEVNKSLQESLARQADKTPDEAEMRIVAKKVALFEGNQVGIKRPEKEDPAEESEDDFTTLAAVHTKLAQMEKAHKKEISNIVAEAESKEEQLEKLVNEHFTALETLKGKICEMEDEHKHVINRLIDEQKMKLKETQTEYEGGNSKIIEELRTKISNLSEAHKAEVNQIKEKFALQQAKLEAEMAEEREIYQRKLKEVKDSLDEKSEFGATSLCGDLETVASDVELVSAMKIAGLETKIETLEQAKRDLEQTHLKEMKVLQEKATAKVNELQKAWNSLEDRTKKQSALKDAEMEELKTQLNTLVDSKKESTLALSETLDLLESQEMYWTEENEGLQAKIAECEVALTSKNELNSKLQALLDDKTRESESAKLSSQQRESELLDTIETLKAGMKSTRKDLEVETAKTKILQAEVHQLRNEVESMQAIIDAAEETSELIAEQHKKELAQLESKIKIIEVDLAAEKAQTGLLQVRVNQLKDKEFSLNQTIEAQKETNEILVHQLEDAADRLEKGPSKEALDKVKGELEAVKSKLAEKKEDEEQTNSRIQDMFQKEVDLNKHIENLVEKMMQLKQHSKDIETKMVRQMETLQAEKNALQGAIMVLSRSLTQQQDELQLAGNESI